MPISICLGMMNMFLYELKKTLFHPKVVYLFVILLLLNSAIFAWQCQQQDVNAKDYREIHQEIASLSLEETALKLTDEITMTTYVQEYREGFSDSAFALEHYGEAWLQALQRQEIKTRSLASLKRVYDEIQGLITYPQYLTDIQNPDKENAISIFQNNNLFTKERQEKVRTHYVDKDLYAGSDAYGSYGMEQVLNFPLLNMFAGFLLLYLLYLQIQKEEETGCLAYVKTMKRGSLFTYCTKLASLCITLGIFLLVAYICMFLISGILYGFPHIGTPIQSILAFRNTPNTFSVYTFLGFAIGTHMFVVFLLTMLLYAFSFLCRHIFRATGIFLLLLAFAQLFSTSSADVNHVSNLFALQRLLSPYSFYANVTYVSVFDHAVSYVWLYVILTLLTLICFSLGAYKYLYGHYHTKKKSMHYTSRQFHSLFYYETRKTWIKGMGLVLAIGMIFIYVLSLSQIKSMSTIQDRRIAYYIDTFGASPTTSTWDLIEKEAQRFEAIDLQLSQTTDFAQQVRLQNELNAYPAFREYTRRMDVLQQDTTKKLLKEDQTRLLFEQPQRDTWMLMGMIVMLILLCMQTYGKEESSGVCVFQATSLKGVNTIFHIKYRTIVIGTSLLWILYTSYLCYYNTRLYPDIAYGEKLQFLSNMNDFPFPFDISIYIFVQGIMQLGLWGMFAYVFLYVFAHVKAHKLWAILLILLLCMQPLLMNLGYINISILTAMFYPYQDIKLWMLSCSVLLLCFMICRYRHTERSHHA